VSYKIFSGRGTKISPRAINNFCLDIPHQLFLGTLFEDQSSGKRRSGKIARVAKEEAREDRSSGKEEAGEDAGT